LQLATGKVQLEIVTDKQQQQKNEMHKKNVKCSHLNECNTRVVATRRGKGQQQRVMSLFNSAIAVVVACCKSVHIFFKGGKVRL